LSPTVEKWFKQFKEAFSFGIIANNLSSLELTIQWISSNTVYLSARW